MTTYSTETGLGIETALPCRNIPLRKRMKLSRNKFSDRFGLDARSMQDWEWGCLVPDQAACVLLTAVDRDPAAVTRAPAAD